MRWIVLALLLPLQALAGSVTLTWTPPTQNTDGTELTDLAGYRLYWGTSSGNYPSSVTIDNPGVTSYVLDGLAAGTYYFAATAFNTAGVESDYSVEATKAVLQDPVAPQPAPPSNLTVVETDMTAYAISQTEDRLVTYPVGTVVAGTSCDPSMTVNGKYLVPRSAVQWAGTVQPQVVVAECG